MKYSAIILSLALGVFALPQEQASTITSTAAIPGYTPTAQQECANKCDDADVTCKAECFGVARPNASQILQTNECAGKCEQGSGSPEDTKKYGECLQDCYAKYYPSSQTLQGPAPASSAAPTMTGDAPASSGPRGTGSQPTGSTSPTTSAGAEQASGTGAADSNKVHLAGAGLAGLALAVFAF